MLPAHEGELPEDTQGKDPAVLNVGALVLSSWSGSWCLGREQSKRGRDFPPGMASLCANKGVGREH